MFQVQVRNPRRAGTARPALRMQTDIFCGLFLTAAPGFGYIPGRSLPRTGANKRPSRTHMKTEPELDSRDEAKETKALHNGPSPAPALFRPKGESDRMLAEFVPPTFYQTNPCARRASSAPDADSKFQVQRFKVRLCGICAILRISRSSFPSFASVQTPKLPNEAMRSARRFEVPGSKFNVVRKITKRSQVEEGFGNYQTKPLSERKIRVQSVFHPWLQIFTTKISKITKRSQRACDISIQSTEAAHATRVVKKLRNEAMRSARQFQVPGSKFNVVRKITKRSQ